MKRSGDETNSPNRQATVPSNAEPSSASPHTTVGSSVEKVRTSDALQYLNDVKNMFRDSPHKYDEFLGVMKDFKAQRIQIVEVIEKVKNLFQGNRDLILGFNNFLPKCYQITLLPEEGLLPKRPVEFQGALGFVNKVKTRFQDDDRMYKAFIETLRKYRKDNIAITEVYQEISTLFSEHPDLDLEFRQFLPESAIAAVPYPTPNENSVLQSGGNSALLGIYSREFAFCEKVQDRFNNSDSYEDFIKFLDVCNRENFSQSDFEYQVRSLFGKHQDLAVGFIDIFPRSGNIDDFLAVLGKRESRSLKGEDRNRNFGRERANRHKGRERGERCTPSYRLLPMDYPIPLASHRTEIGNAVLNDKWVLVNSGSEDYSFKHTRKNQFEEILFRCEDDRFELDMVIEAARSARNRVEDLLNKITDNSVEIDSTFNITDHLTAMNLRCIERLYEDHGLEVMDALKMDAPSVLPVILKRLKQKEEEWANCRIEFNKVWAKVYADNHQKSLEHDSFSLKQKDAKRLRKKALIEEIKKLRGKNIEEDSYVLAAMMVGNRPPIIPEMEFTYPDLEIHNDLYKLIEYSCGEICSSEELKMVLDIWASFLEPMLGTPCQTRAAADAEDVLASNNHISESNPRREGDGRAEMINNENEVDDGTEDVDALGLGNGDETSQTGLAAISARQGNAGGLAEFETRLNAENLLSLKNGDGRMPVASMNAVTTETTEAKGHAEGSIGLLQVDREEGKLSPNGDFEVDNIVIYGGDGMAAGQVPKGNVHSGEAGEDDANDEGIESGPRSMEERWDAFENGDVTGSESDDDEDREGGVVEGLQMAKPLRKLANHALLQVREKDSMIFYGNDSIYVLLRLHQVLYDRIRTVKINVSERRFGASDDSSPTDLYTRFMGALYNLIDGSYDNAKFEDECRTIFGNQLYILFTLDKLIIKIVKQLQYIATDETAGKLFLLYEYENSRRPDAFDDGTYYVNSTALLQDENIYRIVCFSSPTHMYIQLLGSAHEKPEGISLDQKFLDYVSEVYLSSIANANLTSGIFLKRNKLRYPGDDKDQYSAALELVQLVNGLEIKKLSTLHKVHYVLGTEDLLFRSRNKERTVHPNGSSRDQAKSSSRFLTRSQRFNMWLSGR